MNRLPTSAVKSPLPGNLLVASPKLASHPLAGAVVLILEHGPEGAKGVVLNSQANEEVRQWCRSLATQEDKGAVIKQLQAAAKTQEETHGTPFTICMEQPGRSMEEMVDQLGTGVRIFVGNVVWEAALLEQELTSGVWMCLPGFPQLLFGEHENLWATCVKCVGEAVVLSAPGVKPVGDVTWN